MVKIIKNLKLPLVLKITALLSAFVFMIYLGKQINKEAKLIASQRVILSGLNNDLEKLDKILLDRENYRQNIEKIEKSLPGSYYEVAFFTSQIERLATKNNLKMETEIDAKSKEEKGETASLKFALNVNGSYRSFSEFLTDISRLPYHTRVDSLKIEKAGGSLSSVIVFRLFITKE